MIAGVIAGLMDAVMFNRLYGPGNELGFFGAIVNLVLFVPGLSVMARRIRDAGRDPRFWLLVPGLSYFVAVLFFLTGNAPFQIPMAFVGVGSLIFLGAVVIVFFPTKEEGEQDD